MRVPFKVIVCAAIRNKDTGVVVCGPRHGNCLNAVIAYGIDKNPNGDTWICGFVDQENNFYTRAEAWKIADERGQINRPTGWEKNFDNRRPPGFGDEGLLFSENLY